MKIKRLKIQGYKIFDDIELDFTDKDGNALDLVIFAGINGSGKTTIFQLISKLFSESSNVFRPNNPIPIDKFVSDPDSIMCKQIQVDIELNGSSRQAIASLLSNFLRLSKEIKTTSDDKIPAQIETILSKFESNE
jgi:predicted ATP-binding protein involved in virulence